MEVPSSANVNIYECISSMGATANPLKKRSFRCELILIFLRADDPFIQF